MKELKEEVKEKPLTVEELLGMILAELEELNHTINYWDR